jgi:hypothetical protein
MNRSRIVAGAAALTMFVALAIPAYNVGAQMMGSSSVTGSYNVQATGDEFESGVARLTQQGSTVVGTVPAKGGTLHFSGTLSNEKLSGTWRSVSNETGWLTLYFNSNGQGFRGEWGFHGRSPNGDLVGTRVKT